MFWAFNHGPEAQYGRFRILHGLNGLLRNFHGLRVNPNSTQNQKERVGLYFRTRDRFPTSV